MNFLPDRITWTTDIRRDIWVSFIAAAFFSIESWVLGPLSWIYGYGSGLETIPALKALTFDGRNFSLWAPFVAGGVDRLAFWGNANPVGPEYLLFSTLPTWLANGSHRFLQYVVAVFFASRVAAEQLGLKGIWGNLGGIMYGCFSYFTVGALFTLPGLPLMLWLLSHSLDRPRKYLKSACSAVLMSFTTTFTFGVPYLLAFAVLWLLAVQRPNWRSALGPFAIFSVVLMILTAPQLLAIAANAAASHRADWDFEPITLSIDGLLYRQLQYDMFAQNRAMSTVTMNLPWLAFLAGVPLAWLGWRHGGAAKKVSIGFLSVALIFTLVSQKWAWLFLQVAVSQFAPFARGVYMGRFFQIPAPFLIAMGLTLVVRLAWLLAEKQGPTRRCVWVATAALVAFMSFTPKVHLFYDLGVNDWGQANYEVRAVDALREQPGPFRVASVLPLQPTYAYAQGLEAADGWANVYPAVYRDLWLRVLAPLFDELPLNRQIFGADSGRGEDNFILLGSDLMWPETGLLRGDDVFESLRDGFDVDRRFNFYLLGLLNVRYLLSEYPLRGTHLRLVHAADPWPTWPQYRSRNTGLVEGPRKPALVDFGHAHRLLEPLLDYIQATQQKLRGKDVFIYEITTTLDRFRLVSSVVIEPDGNAVLDRLSVMDTEALRMAAVLEAADAGSVQKRSKLANGRIDLVAYRPDRIDLKVTVVGDAYLVIANTWSPYWTAEVDGQGARLIRTNHAQYGLPLAVGTHDVVLTYRPPYVFGLFTLDRFWPHDN